MTDDVQLLGLFYRGDGPPVGPLAPAEVDRLLADAPASEELDARQAQQGQDHVGPLRVLVVDDDPRSAERSAALVRRHGGEVGAVCDGAAALGLALVMRPDVALIDERLSDMTGFDKALQLLLQAPGELALVAAVSGRGDQRWAGQTLACGPAGTAGTAGVSILDRLRSVRAWLPRRDNRDAGASPGPKVQRSGDVTVLTLAAHPKQATGDRIAVQLEGCTEDLRQGHLLLDFRKIDRISSEELGTLLRLQKATNAAGGRLTLFNLTASVLEVFTITNLDKILAICREQPPTSDSPPTLFTKENP